MLTVCGQLIFGQHLCALDWLVVLRRSRAYPEGAERRTAPQLYISPPANGASRGFRAIVTNLRGMSFAVTLGFMLKALWRLIWPPDAEKTQTQRTERYVTSEQLELALEKYAREQEFEMNEWYEKFNTLHLRLSKRDKRKATAVEQEQQEVEESVPSIIHLRRFGSP